VDNSLQPRVARVDRTRVVLLWADGREEFLPVAAAVAVGDLMDAAALPELVPLERSGVLTRRTSGGRDQVLAANVDVVLLTLPAGSGHRSRLVERLAALGWGSGAAPMFVLTKCDLLTPADLAEAVGAVAASAPGIPIAAVSSATGEGVSALLEELQGRTAVMLGHSGVGKTSLANRITDGPDHTTADTRERDGKGRHTTTHRQLHPLTGGSGWLIDTPGVRELGLSVDADDLDLVFPEIELLAQECRFRDCSHTGEPGCALQAAIERGDLDPERLTDHRQLAAEIDYAERSRGPATRDKSREWTRHAREYRRARGR
jgi:ribosome biogenesis GTPase